MTIKVTFDIDVDKLPALAAWLEQPETEPVKRESKPKETPVPEPESAPCPVYTQEQVVEKASGLIRTHRAEIKALLNKYEAPAVSKLKPEVYDAFMADLEALNG